METEIRARKCVNLKLASVKVGLMKNKNTAKHLIAKRKIYFKESKRIENMLITSSMTSATTSYCIANTVRSLHQITLK